MVLKLPYLGILGSNPKKLLLYLKLVLSNLLQCKVSCKTKKLWILGPKILYWGIFRHNFEENYCHISNEQFRICETKKKYVWKQNAYFVSTFRVEFEKTIVESKFFKVSFKTNS